MKKRPALEATHVGFKADKYIWRDASCPLVLVVISSGSNPITLTLEYGSGEALGDTLTPDQAETLAKALISAADLARSLQSKPRE